MADINHTLIIKAPPAEVFHAVATPEGLDLWWTQESSGNPAVGETYELNFTEEYQWKAKVLVYNPDAEVTYEITEADADWTGTQVSFRLTNDDGHIRLDFSHTGWKYMNEHYRISSYCWAMYLRILKRNLELGEFVPYDERDLA